MIRIYKCLPSHSFVLGSCELQSIRDEDRYIIMKWRNDQIDILRQKNPLAAELQDKYFKQVVSELFEIEKPNQLLFSFFRDGNLIGYGGFVHIDWDSRNAEISFITETSRNLEVNTFKNDWKDYLRLLKTINQLFIGFVKIYTYAYDLRPYLYPALIESGFKEEARLRSHVRVNDNFRDVLIHSFFTDTLCFRIASHNDCRMYFDWANDQMVRDNSFNTQKIIWNEHVQWFEKKIRTNESLLLVALYEQIPAGQIRLDKLADGIWEIDFSVSKNHRGMGLGTMILVHAFKASKIIWPDFKKLVGKVRPLNYSSIRSFEKAEFKKIDIGEYITFEKCV